MSPEDQEGGKGVPGAESGEAAPIDSTAALARHLGLSRWTVSRVLNGHGGVRAETRERVRRAMRESGFEPNLYARSLRGGRTRTIGVCIQELDSPSLSRKVAELQDEFRRRDYHSLLELTARDHSLEERVLRHFLNLKIDGIVGIGTCLSPTSALVRELEDSAIPVLLVDPETILPFPIVEVDRAAATRLMLEFLWAEGHRCFGLAGFDPDYTYSAYRLEGVAEFFRENPLDGPVWSLFERGTVRHDFSYGDRLAESIAAGPVLPSAILAVNDRVAVGLLAGLGRRGLDLAVVGHDNLDFAPYFDPPLTTVDQRTSVLMKTAAGGLVGWLETGDIPPRRTRLPTELKVRESHRCVPGLGRGSR
ncbi:MAG: LacI family DNA-binding transcriptional regulator [Puniceicoccaceae bacterium]